MKSFLAWSLAAVAVPVLALALPARGAQPSATAETRLTDEGLLKLLKGLGYEPTVTKSADGSITYHRIDKTVGNFRYIMDVSLQEKGRYIAFSCPLKRVGEPEKVPADKLWAVLSKNDEIQPMAFSYAASMKQFFLNLQIDNDGVTPARMQNQLDQLRHTLQSTSTVWDTSRWPGGPQPAPAVTEKVTSK